MKTIDCTPTWEGILLAYLEVYANAETAEAKNSAVEELTRMAKLADSANERARHFLKESKFVVVTSTFGIDDSGATGLQVTDNYSVFEPQNDSAEGHAYKLAEQHYNDKVASNHYDIVYLAQVLEHHQSLPDVDLDNKIIF